jgi:hypothetical protein
MPTLNWIGKDTVVKHHKDVLDLCHQVPSRYRKPPKETLQKSLKIVNHSGHHLFTVRRYFARFPASQR